MDLHNNFYRDRHWYPTVAIDAAFLGQAYEIIASLTVVWPGDSGANATRLHCVVTLLVCLYVFTEFHLVMSIEVQFEIEYDLRRALGFGHSTLEGKHAAPEHGCIYHLYYYDGEEVVKPDHVVTAENLVFCSAVVSLDS